MEGDVTNREVLLTQYNFNPLPPCGGRLVGVRSFESKRNFNPLPPCGGRLVETDEFEIDTTFQSTPSVWRETDGKC